MPDQLRMYTIKPGEMAAWQEEWGRLIVPLRRRNGFEIVGAWTTEPDQFVWILRCTGPKTWEDADAAYYASPERTAMQPDPARHITKSEQWLMSPAGEGQADIVPSPSGGGQGGGGSDGSITATEVITYAGALVTLAGLGTLLGTQYRQLGVIGRTGIPGLVAIAALVAARLLPGQRARGRRAQTSLVTLGIAAVAFFIGQLQAELAGGPDASIPPDTGYRIILLAALASVILAGVALYRLRAGLLAAELSVALVVTGVSFIAWAHLQDAWPRELVFVGVAIVLLAGAEYGRGLKILWGTEILGFFSLTIPIVVAFIVAGDGNLPMELLAGLLAVGAFAAAVYRGSAGYALAGGVGLFAFVLDIEFRYFRSSLGFAVSLVISGLALLGIALLLTRLVPRLRRETPILPSPREGR
jgi:NIPSNAP